MCVFKSLPGFLLQVEHNLKSFPWTHPLPLSSSFAFSPLIAMLRLHWVSCLLHEYAKLIPTLSLLFSLAALCMDASLLALNQHLQTLGCVTETDIFQNPSSGNSHMTRVSSLHFFFLIWRIITLQYCVGHSIQQCESAISIHMSPPSWTSLQLPSHPTPLDYHTAPGWAPCVIQQLHPGYLFYTWRCGLPRWS